MEAGGVIACLSHQAERPQVLANTAQHAASLEQPLTAGLHIRRVRQRE